ncbi:MAG: glycosyltransferase family 2 protein [Planctomycetes bacterium]|nr:glycosyltransferase family 2 protein [Planctomycetota bacterium]
MSEVLVTIGIPFLNSQNTLLDAIRSIFAQTYTNWELLLVDDGSSDSSLEIAKSINDSRVRVISDGKNKKLPARLNQIVKLAQGEYIMRMDADDICSPIRIQKQVEFLQAHSDVDVVGTSILYLNENRIPLGVSIMPTEHQDICKKPMRFFSLCHPSIMARKDWYQRNAYNETNLFAEDFELWLNSYETSKFSNIVEPYYFYVLGCEFNLRKQFIARKSTAKFIFERLKKTNLKKAILYWLQQYIKFAITAVMFGVGMKTKLIARRYQPITTQEKNRYQEMLDSIEQTPISTRSTI